MTSVNRSVQRPAGSAWLVVVATVLLAGLPAAGLQGQDRFSTRQQLQDELQRLEQVAARGGNEDSVAAVRQQIATIRTRLSEGDFYTGDVLRLQVAADTALTGDFRVSSSKMLELPTIENVDLDGVLYAEADSVVRQHLGRYLKDTRIRVQVTRRMAVVGAVQQPGFYDFSPGTTLSDAIMRAGGPASNARLEDVELRRGGRDVFQDRTVNLQRVTLADLGPGADDELFIPQTGGGLGVVGILGIVSGVTGTAFAISRIF